MTTIRRLVMCAALLAALGSALPAWADPTGAPQAVLYELTEPWNRCG